MKTHLSNKLMTELHNVGLIDLDHCDKDNLQRIIREYFCKVHKCAVEGTLRAKNKINFIYPQFHDEEE